MNKIVLDKYEVQELVAANRYPVNPKTRFLSRCIDGRYENKKDLEALAFPGADAGELALLFAAANLFSFDLDKEKAYQSLVDLVGGERGLRFHTDSHVKEKTVLVGCGHIKQMNLDLEAYGLHKDQIEFVQNKFQAVLQKGVKQEVLEGNHLEAAVLMVKGDYGIYPRYKLETTEKQAFVQVFIYHQSLVDQRHKEWAKRLISEKTVTLYNGCDTEYLYEALSDTAERHLFETAKRLAHGLPICSVAFDKKGNFTIGEMGKI